MNLGSRVEGRAPATRCPGASRLRRPVDGASARPRRPPRLRRTPHHRGTGRPWSGPSRRRRTRSSQPALQRTSVLPVVGHVLEMQARSVIVVGRAASTPLAARPQDRAPPAQLCELIPDSRGSHREGLLDQKGVSSLTTVTGGGATASSPAPSMRRIWSPYSASRRARPSRPIFSRVRSRWIDHRSRVWPSYVSCSQTTSISRPNRLTAPGTSGSRYSRPGRS